MELENGLKNRRSIRRFEDKAVPHEVLRDVVDLAAYAPSWKNKQIARYIVVEDKAKLKMIAEDCTLGFKYNISTVSHAPALVLLTYKRGRSGFEKDGTYTTPKGDGYEMFDAGIAAQTFCLAAHSKGLGTCIMGIFDEAKIREVVAIPEDQSLGALIVVGYPGETPDAPPRKCADELVVFDA